jgi:hypothetical protein
VGDGVDGVGDGVDGVGDGVGDGVDGVGDGVGDGDGSGVVSMVVGTTVGCSVVVSFAMHKQTNTTKGTTWESMNNNSKRFVFCFFVFLQKLTSFSFVVCGTDRC